MFLRGHLAGITPQQFYQLSAQLASLQQQLSAENVAWNNAVAYSEHPPASDQHNATVAQLQGQIAFVSQQLQQPVDWPAAPAPAPIPSGSGGGYSAPASAPPPVQSPSGAPAVAPSVTSPQATPGGAGMPGSPLELDVPSYGAPSQQYIVDPNTGQIVEAPKSDLTKILLLALAAGAAVMGSG